MPEWMATGILALLLGLAGGFAAHYTPADPWSHPLTDDLSSRAGLSTSTGVKRILTCASAQAAPQHISSGLPPIAAAIAPEAARGTGNQREKRDACYAASHTFCVGSSAPLDRSCSASALHARSRFPVSRRTVVTMGPGFPIAILPGIVAELGRIF